MDDISSNNEASLGIPFKKTELMHAGILYSIAMALFLFIPPVIRPLKLKNFYIVGLFSEILLVLLPAILLLLYCGYDIKNVLRLKKVSFMNLFMTFWIMVFALPAVGVLNLLNLWLVKVAFGRVSNINIPVAKTWVDLLLGILVIAGSAGICEEIMFRGVIQRGFERFGGAWAIIITSILFGLMHRDMERLFGTAALGALIGFLVYRSNSILSGMFAHFTNNSIAVIMTFVAYQLEKFSESHPLKGVKGHNTDVISSLSSTPKAQLIFAIISWAIIVLGSTAVLAAILYAYVKNTSGKVVKARKEKVNQIGKNLAWLVPGLAMVGFIFTVQGLGLRRTGYGFITGIVKFLGLG